MKNKQLNLNFYYAFPSNVDGTDWDLGLDQNVLDESTIRAIKDRLSYAFHLGMEYKAKQLRECLQIKETIELR